MREDGRGGSEPGAAGRAEGGEPLRVLVALTYYRPHISGLTLYVERLAQGLARRGHSVTILTSQYDPRLPREEEAGGVRVVRVQVAFRVSKGVVMPSYGAHATRLVRAHDVVSVHLPQFDAWGLVLRSRLFRKPSVLTYHCDLRLPPGRLNRVADRLVGAVNLVAAAFADRIVAYTRDYADSVPLLRRFLRKVVIVRPPVVMPEPEPGAGARFLRERGVLGDDAPAGPVIGMAARFAAEKGIGTLVEAAALLVPDFPGLRVAFAGQHEGLVGEEASLERLAPRIAQLGRHWTFLGPLDPVAEMPAFFAALDCLVVASVNSTESFGLVQVESMLCGTPVVATDMPGVREPVRLTGMGEIVPPGDPVALAAALRRVVRARDSYVRARPAIAALFDLDETLDCYERLFAEAGRARRHRLGTGRSARPTR